MEEINKIGVPIAGPGTLVADSIIGSLAVTAQGTFPFRWV